MKSVGGKNASPMRRTLRFAVSLLVLGAACWGVWIGVLELDAMWKEQCTVVDAREQISINATAHVSEELVRNWFGLTNGCNLARIDFAGIRSKVMSEYPIVKDMTITRHLPSRLDISLEERVPIARVNLKPMKLRINGKDVATVNWDVADAEGVVFDFAKKDTQMLPIINEPTPSTKRGERLSGRASMALRLVDLCSRDEFASMSLPEVSTANATYLTATTRNYSTVRIDWRLVDDPDNPEQPNLMKILSNLRDTMNTKLCPAGCTFTVTDLDRVSMLERESRP